MPPNMLATRASMLSASGTMAPQLSKAAARLSHMPLCTCAPANGSRTSPLSSHQPQQTRQLSLAARPQIKATPSHISQPILLKQPLSKRQFSATARPQLKEKKTFFPEPENKHLIRTTRPAWEHPG